MIHLFYGFICVKSELICGYFLSFGVGSGMCGLVDLWVYVKNNNRRITVVIFA